MVAAFRAAISAVMLAGFYLLALAMLAGIAGVGIWLASVTSAVVAAKLLLPLFVASIGAVAVALWRTLRAKPEPPSGLMLDPVQAPQLWQLVHELAGVVRTRVPNEIRVIPKVNAAVVEQSRLLGLIGGRRVLYIGLPLLQFFTQDQLRSVLAHELGHYSGLHTRLGALAYRGRMAISETIGRLGPHNVVGWVFKGYARLYLLADTAVLRRQELAADQASVRVAGRTAATSALRELPVLDAAWDFYLSRYVELGWEHGYAPDDLFGGFASLVNARKEELERLRSAEPHEERSVWDTHPPITERIAAIATTPEQARYRDDRPAALLLTDLADISRRLQAATMQVGERTPLPWPQFTNAALTARMQRQADAIFRQITRTVRAPEIDLAGVFELIAAGRAGEIAEPFFPQNTRREAAKLFADILEQLLQLAALRSGVAVFRHSWSEPAKLVAVTGGEPMELRPIAELVLQRDRLSDAYEKLVFLGIDVKTVGLVERTATAAGARALAGLANVKVNSIEYDLVVLNKGLVLIPNPGKSQAGRKRLEQLLANEPIAEVAARNWFLPYEEVTSASVTRKIPVRAELVLHDGRRVTIQESWSGEELAKDSREILLRVLDQLAAG